MQSLDEMQCDVDSFIIFVSVVPVRCERRQTRLYAEKDNRQTKTGINRQSLGEKLCSVYRYDLQVSAVHGRQRVAV